MQGFLGNLRVPHVAHRAVHLRPEVVVLNWRLKLTPSLCAASSNLLDFERVSVQTGFDCSARPSLFILLVKAGSSKHQAHKLQQKRKG